MDVLKPMGKSGWGVGKMGAFPVSFYLQQAPQSWMAKNDLLAESVPSGEIGHSALGLEFFLA